MRLEDLTIGRPTWTINIGGVDFTLHALTSAEREAIGAALPLPRAPERVIQENGQRRVERDAEAPAYIRQRRAWHQTLRAAHLGAALHWETQDAGAWRDGSPPDDLAAWMKAVNAELDTRLTDAEMEHLYAELNKLEASRFAARDRIGDGERSGN